MQFDKTVSRQTVLIMPETVTIVLLYCNEKFVGYLILSKLMSPSSCKCRREWTQVCWSRTSWHVQFYIFSTCKFLMQMYDKAQQRLSFQLTVEAAPRVPLNPKPGSWVGWTAFLKQHVWATCYLSVGFEGREVHILIISHRWKNFF